MNMLNHFNRHAVLLVGALLLCANLGVHADEIEDANKLFKQGQRSQALDKVNDYLASKPKDAPARFLKGLILTEQGKTTDAIKIFTALTDDYPDLPEPYNNLAVLYAGQSQYDKAKQLLERAISTHPSYSTAHENLGDIYAKMASQAYDRALQLDHGNTTTQTKLAMIQNLFADGTRNKETAARSTPVSSKAEEAVPVAMTGSQSEPPGQSKVAATVARPPEHMGKKDSGKEVLETVKAWAAAWSAKNTDKYLSFYADDFKTAGGEARAVWEAARKDRISKPKYIRVSVGNITTQFVDSDHVTVKFRQTYRSSHLKSSGNKTLLMEKVGGKWLIQEERS
jgi:tetratricopeptide (TPR) repeat protein